MSASCSVQLLPSFCELLQLCTLRNGSNSIDRLGRFHEVHAGGEAHLSFAPAIGDCTRRVGLHKRGIDNRSCIRKGCRASRHAVSPLFAICLSISVWLTSKIPRISAATTACLISVSSLSCFCSPLNDQLVDPRNVISPSTMQTLR